MRKGDEWATSKNRRDVILASIKMFIGAYGYPPSIREIAMHVELSPSNVLHHLKGLEREKRIVRSPHVSRGIKLL